MAANLTQQYRKAEQAYRAAQTVTEELACLQVMLRELPKHKGTDKLQADLKQKISQAKKAVEQARANPKGPRFRIPRQGAGRVILIGGPNAGKSQLLKSLTRADPEVADYPYSTRQPLVGMMPFEDISVQLIDTPPVTSELFDPHTQTLVRGADLVLLLVDLAVDDGVDLALQAMRRFQQSKTRLAPISYLSPTDVGVSYTATIAVFNKSDIADAASRLAMIRELLEWEFGEATISAQRGEGLDELRRMILEALDVVRVYTKMPNQKEADLERPFTLRRGGTLLDVAELIHADLASRFRYAKVWGEHVHDGATMTGDYVVHDKDIVEIHA